MRTMVLQVFMQSTPDYLGGLFYALKCPLFLHTEGATGSNPVTPTTASSQVGRGKCARLACCYFAVSSALCRGCVAEVSR